MSILDLRAEDDKSNQLINSNTGMSVLLNVACPDTIYQRPHVVLEALMPQSKKQLRRPKTPIERIFSSVFEREMTAKERRILLAPSDKTRKQN
jgi:hypothetical protein